MCKMIMFQFQGKCMHSKQDDVVYTKKSCQISRKSIIIIHKKNIIQCPLESLYHKVTSQDCSSRKVSFGSLSSCRQVAAQPKQAHEIPYSQETRKKTSKKIEKDKTMFRKYHLQYSFSFPVSQG